MLVNMEEKSEVLEDKSEVLEDQMQYSRRNCLVFTGIAEKKGEDTDKVIQSFASEFLEVEISDNEIDRSHRLGKRQTGKPRPIIVKFVRYNMRRKVMRERRKLRGKNLGVQEHLTPFTEHLLRKANELSRKAPWLKKTWTWDGRVTCLVQYSNEHPEQKVTVKNNEDLNKIWLKGEKLSPKSPLAKRKITDPDYMETASEKT